MGYILQSPIVDDPITQVVGGGGSVPPQPERRKRVVIKIKLEINLMFFMFLLLRTVMSCFKRLYYSGVENTLLQKILYRNY